MMMFRLFLHNPVLYGANRKQGGKRSHVEPAASA